VTDTSQWSVWEISDADEPGDHVLVGMNHRDFDGVILLLMPDGEHGDTGWYGTPATSDGRPTRPVLLFYRGTEPNVEDARARVENSGLDGTCGPAVTFPTTFDTPTGGDAAVRTIPFHLNYPPYPWLEEAKLGMGVGRYFDSVELVDWTDPTDSEPGSHTFRFSRRARETANRRPDPDFDPDDLPF